jgi:cysteine-rich repeat protein
LQDVFRPELLNRPDEIVVFHAPAKPPVQQTTGLLLAAVVALAPQAAWADCGDGTKETGEDCDDGNATSGDGCSASCGIDAGWECEETAYGPDFSEDMTDDIDANVPASWSKAGATFTESANSVPSVYMLDLPADVATLTFDIEVETADGDDFVGFAIGFEAGEGSDASAEWLLVDWKQVDQDKSPCTAEAGLALCMVSGPLTPTDEWCRTGSVSEVARATTLGSTGWSDETSHAFEVVASSTQIQVWVDATLELDETGTWPTGNLGFYVYSHEASIFTLTAALLRSTCVRADGHLDGLTDEDFPEANAPCDGPDGDACANGFAVCRADGLGVACPAEGYGITPQDLQD